VAKRKRNYRAEYKRRIDRALAKGYTRAVARGHAPKGTAGIKAAKFLGVNPGADLDDLIERDAKYTFGRKPKRRKDDTTPPEYQLRLEEMWKRDGRFDWRSEAEFIEQMQGLGFSKREAYTLWFSP
jgi:hypothetical protein